MVVAPPTFASGPAHHWHVDPESLLRSSSCPQTGKRFPTPDLHKALMMGFHSDDVARCSGRPEAFWHLRRNTSLLPPPSLGTESLRSLPTPGSSAPAQTYVICLATQCDGNECNPLIA
ncbi:Hypothetical predicted protein [Podarcis lilfordi]|uniref:Uncharacterized protein n=1 Tax=Podarcis lilfordi TaxID=74358 RepID=A0AA35L6I3_9SAUR|nr:Hypothetical predicted protein [Podarcis lilfordi]